MRSMTATQDNPEEVFDIKYVASNIVGNICNLDYNAFVFRGMAADLARNVPGVQAPSDEVFTLIFTTLNDAKDILSHIQSFLVHSLNSLEEYRHQRNLETAREAWDRLFKGKSQPAPEAPVTSDKDDPFQDPTDKDNCDDDDEEYDGPAAPAQ